VQLKDVDRSNPDDLREIFVRGKDETMVALSNLVTINETVAPKELNHFNKLRSATLTATLAPGYAMGDALTFLDEQAVRLPQGLVTDLNGQSREFRTSTGGLYITFLLALAFIYLVLAAQFESWVDPFIIMLTVPLSMTGALLALKLTGQSMNVYSQIGLVTLVGLITKHGILIVEFANQLQDQGRTKLEAVIEAATLRLRPILMTTGAMVLGSVGGCREPAGDRLGGRGRPAARDAAHALRGADRLHAHGHDPAPHRPRRGPGRGTPAGRVSAGRTLAMG
jgi:multidrug efflux pump